MIVFLKAHPAIRTMIGGDPTPAQAASGRYPKERMAWQGLTIAIEHPEGTVREGVDETGKAWRTVFRFAYGEILGTTGLDGDPVDVFIGSYPDAPEVYIVQQMRRKRWDEPDEQKCMINFGSIDEAKAAYLGHYDDPRFFGGITAMPVAEFVAKVRATRAGPAMIKAAGPVVLFLKGHVGAYLRGGRIVNVAGYQGRAARGKPSEGQMSLFADSAPPEKKEHASSNLSNNSPIESKRENVMHYHGNDDQISTSDVSWETAKGEVKITLIRNAELGVNGWMRSAGHKIQLKLGGESVSYYGDAQDPVHGFVLKADMGRITVRVPADKAEAVRALLREREENNDAASRAAYQAEAEGRQRRRGVNDMMTAGGRSY